MITLLTNVCIVKAIFLPVIMYGCESWTIKNAKRQRIDAFELWCWRRLLRVPWTARRLKQSYRKSVLNIHWKDWCWSWNSNTLATWCEDLLEKTLMLGKTEGGRRRGQQRWLDGITNSMDRSFEQVPGVGDGQESLACCSPWGHKELDTIEPLNWLTEFVKSCTNAKRDC